MRKTEALVGLALLLVASGCSTAPAQFQRSGAPEGALEQDQRGCRSESSRMTRENERRQTNAMIDSGAPIGSGSIHTDLLASDLRSASLHAFEQCMIRRGWSLKKKEVL
jgi:hypothetical protein